VQVQVQRNSNLRPILVDNINGYLIPQRIRILAVVTDSTTGDPVNSLSATNFAFFPASSLPPVDRIISLGYDAAVNPCGLPGSAGGGLFSFSSVGPGSYVLQYSPALLNGASNWPPGVCVWFPGDYPFMLSVYGAENGISGRQTGGHRE
jgi:hypothetical protein